MQAASAPAPPSTSSPATVTTQWQRLSRHLRSSVYPSSSWFCASRWPPPPFPSPSSSSHSSPVRPPSPSLCLLLPSLPSPLAVSSLLYLPAVLAEFMSVRPPPALYAETKAVGHKIRPLLLHRLSITPALLRESAPTSWSRQPRQLCSTPWTSSSLWRRWRSMAPRR